MNLLPAFNERMLWTFPCGLDKKPRTKHGFKDAVQGVWWPRAELAGVPTGRRNDFDVLDIDGDAGLKWYERNYDALPATRAHSTQRGMHLLFRHAPGLHCSTSEIAPGIDVRTTGGYCIWWPREGLPIFDAPLSEWPGWLWEEARGKSVPSGDLSTFNSSLPPVHGDAALLTKALFELDPCEWRSENDQARYGQWLRLMMACKAVGISKEDWIAWCMRDKHYAGDEDEIGRKWDGVAARHGWALFKALAAKGKARRAGLKSRSAEVSTEALPTPKPSLRPKSDLRDHSRYLTNWLNRNPREDALFYVACLFAERGMLRDVAEKVLRSDCTALRNSLGADEFARTISNAFTHIQTKRGSE